MASRGKGIVMAALAVGALGAAAGGGFWLGGRMGEDPVTRLALSTCGLVPAPAPIELPLGVMLQKAGAPGLTLGPILHPGLDTPVSLHFRALAPGETPQPLRSGDRLEVPLDAERLPDELRLACRYGEVARIEYRRGPLRHVVDVAVAPQGGTDSVGEVAGGPDAGGAPVSDYSRLAVPPGP